MQQTLLPQPHRVHVAIMKKSWGLIPKILEGIKTVESRWYQSKTAPWNRIYPGDTLFFKNSGEPVTCQAVVTEVQQYRILSNQKAMTIMRQYAQADLGSTVIPDEVQTYISNKNYAIFVSFDSVEEIRPFNIDKTGFGAMSAWLIVKDIDQIKV